MEFSKTQERITSLGEQLVNSLGKGFDVGPMARWMSHYIAEQMTLAESATGETRTAAQQRCFDMILKLWSKRAAIPGVARPFRNFEPLFEVLERLDLKPRSFYGIRSGLWSREEPDGDVAKIVQIVTTIDQTARALIVSFLSVAVSLCKDDSTLGYLKAAQEDMHSADVRAVFHLLSGYDSDDDPTIKQFERDKENLETLDRFVALALGARKMLAARLGKSGEKVPKTQGKRGKPKYRC